MDQSHAHTLAIVASVRAALSEQETQLERLRREAALLQQETAASDHSRQELSEQLSSTFAGIAYLRLARAARAAAPNCRQQLQDQRAGLAV